MTETQKRIKAYKAALPDLRERVIAVAMLLVMSMSMMVSATFAWVTLSAAPEVSGVSTTVAANGNLEIALSNKAGTQPAESAVGDSSATAGQSVVNANMTWGNLVNLSDPSYGLESLTLRPAQLNTAALLTSPLFGAQYSDDGRVENLTSNFDYATWVMPEGDVPGYFGVSEDYGVRAISSTKIEAVGAEAEYYKKLDDAKAKNLMAGSIYSDIASEKNKAWMGSLATMMGLYMTARMNPSDASLSNPTCEVEDIVNLSLMYDQFKRAFEAEAEALASLATLQAFLQSETGEYVTYNAEMIFAGTTASMKAQGIQITDLDTFNKNYKTICTDLLKLQELSTSGTSLKWKDSGLNTIVNNLVNVGNCTIGADNTPISSIGASNAMGYLSGTQEAKITNGILYNFELRTGTYIEVKGLSISATVKRSGITVPATVKANITTTAPREHNLFNDDLEYAMTLNDGSFGGGVPVAEDTYGMAVDLWVRTNALDSYLTLEGNVLTNTRYVRATGRDITGNEVELYTVTLSGEDENGETISYSLDVYQSVAEDGTVTWHRADNYSELTEEDLDGATPTAKMDEVIDVIGYEGENRIWQDNEMLSSDSTTQGSGSCYVYYADTPEDQARSLRLLEAMSVAFVDDEGKLMTVAEMDTEHFYAASGRVIVPLKLRGDSINLGEDENGSTVYAITELKQNVPTRITAIVYLDGTKLTNNEVLAAADIEGRLNIQFGSSEKLIAIGDEALETAIRSVSASVDKTEFDYDTATTAMTSRVSVIVSGEEPTNVTAFFLRSINATQGSREETMTFTKDDSGAWIADHTFTTPGEYILRTVRLDGVDYDLDVCPTVTVKGFTIKSLSCEQATNRHISVMTAESQYPVTLKLQFASDDPDKLPKEVQGRFLREDGTSANVYFTYDATTQIWSGSATFRNSGDYTMQYLVLDGEYLEMEENYWHTATVYLGMQVAVYTTSPTSFKYLPSEMTDNMKLLAMQVKIMDNTGNEMPGLTDVKLTYPMKGSVVYKMDTNLTWDGTYYVGELTTFMPGAFQFGNVTVGGNIITRATTSPTFSIAPAEPPEYVDEMTSEYQVVLDSKDKAQMYVRISNSAAAQNVKALIRKADGTETWVDGVIGNTTEEENAEGKLVQVSQWGFKVPEDANGYQDGNWTLTKLMLYGLVYDANGMEYTEEAPLEIDVTDQNIKTKAVSRVYVTFAQDESKDFGKDANGNVTAQFMTSHTISDLDMNIMDFEGKAIEVTGGVTDVKLTFEYVSGTSATYGGYTRYNSTGQDELSKATEGATIIVPLTADSTGTHFVQGADATILYAGNYTTTISYKIGTNTYTLDGSLLPENAPKFTVSSVKPTVRISAISPTGTMNVDTSGSGSSGGSANGHKDNGATASRTDTAATVYFKCAVANYLITKLHNYTRPSVTMTISGMGNATHAEMSFGSGVHVYNGSTQTDKYEWTKNGTCARNIGYYNGRTGRSDQKTPAGTITSNALKFTYNGIEYTFSVPTITINNPY